MGEGVLAFVVPETDEVLILGERYAGLALVVAAFAGTQE